MLRKITITLAVLLMLPVLVLLYVLYDHNTKIDERLRLQPSNLNSVFNFDTRANFSDYITHMRDIIEKARVDLDSPFREEIINSNAPYEARPENYDGKKAVLLVHGFTTSPGVLDNWKDYFYKKGFLVRSVLLPGHGTVPGDLLEVKYQDWAQAVNYGVKSLQGEAEKVYIAGYSLGGGLALHYALKNDDVAGVAVMAPLVRISDIRAPLTLLFKYFVPWHKVKDDKSFTSYGSRTMNAPAEMYMLTKEIARLGELKDISTPVFMVQPHADTEVNPTDNINFFLDNVKNPKSKLIYYTNEKVADGNSDPRIVFQSATEKKNQVSDYGHIGLIDPVGDLDEHIKRGLKYFCRRYADKHVEYNDCLNTPKQNITFGEDYAKDDETGNITLRLKFNPTLDSMFTAMEESLGLND